MAQLSSKNSNNNNNNLRSSQVAIVESSRVLLSGGQKEQRMFFLKPASQLNCVFLCAIQLTCCWAQKLRAESHENSLVCSSLSANYRKPLGEFEIAAQSASSGTGKTCSAKANTNTHTQLDSMSLFYLCVVCSLVCSTTFCNRHYH